MRVVQTIVAAAVLLGLTAHSPAQAQELHHLLQNWLDRSAVRAPVRHELNHDRSLCL